jgi:hypothetical protein
MLTQENLNVLKKYDYYNDDLPSLHKASKAITDLLGVETSVCGYYSEKIEFRLRIKTNLVSSKTGEKKEFTLILDCVDSYTNLRIPNNGLQLDSSSMSLDFTNSITTLLNKVTAEEGAIINILMLNMPYLNHLNGVRKVCSVVKRYYKDYQELLKLFGPIKNEEELKKFSTKLYKLPYDKWPNYCYFPLNSKSENRDNVISNIRKIEDLIVEIKKLEFSSKNFGR